MFYGLFQGYSSVLLVENKGIFHLFTCLTVLHQFGCKIRNIFSLFVEKEGKSGLNKERKSSYINT